MNLFTGIRHSVDELGERIHRVDRILTHQKWVVRGYMFLVEDKGKHYLLVNRKDVELAIARLPSKTVRGMDFSKIFDIPVSDDEEDMTKVLNGIFKWACKLQ